MYFSGYSVRDKIMVMNGIKKRFNKHNIIHRLAEHFVFRLNYNIIIIIPAEAVLLFSTLKIYLKSQQNN